jgi:dTDP-4-amino-4,6-dideoxygalactose transaminase
MTEICAAIARIQLRKLPSLNTIRLELVEQFKQGIARYDFIKPLEGLKKCGNCNCPGNAKCKPTYYVFPLTFQSSAAPKLTREAFVSAMNAEGMLYYQGYSKPIYLQPIYQQRYLFKHGYPFSAIENEECTQDYSLGRCPVAERLYFKDIIINEHIRPPHTPKDVNDLLLAIEKLTTN